MSHTKSVRHGAAWWSQMLMGYPRFSLGFSQRRSSQQRGEGRPATKTRTGLVKREERKVKSEEARWGEGTPKKSKKNKQNINKPRTGKTHKRSGRQRHRESQEVRAGHGIDTSTQMWRGAENNFHMLRRIGQAGLGPQSERSGTGMLISTSSTLIELT